MNSIVNFGHGKRRRMRKRFRFDGDLPLGYTTPDDILRDENGDPILDENGQVIHEPH
jgi:hypothetical protein